MTKGGFQRLLSTCCYQPSTVKFCDQVVIEQCTNLNLLLTVDCMTASIGCVHLLTKYKIIRPLLYNAETTTTLNFKQQIIRNIYLTEKCTSCNE